MNDRPGRRYGEIVAALALLLTLTALTRCAPAPAPLPVPPVPPARRAIIGGGPALAAGYAGSSSRLAAYRALPPCAPSGSVVCFDPDIGEAAASAEREAHAALAGAKRSGSAMREARERLRLFRAAVEKLPTQGKPQ